MEEDSRGYTPRAYAPRCGRMRGIRGAHEPSVYREIEAMQTAGMSAAEVYRSATIVAAEAMGLGRAAGRAAAGRRADLVVLDAEPTVNIGNARKLRSQWSIHGEPEKHVSEPPGGGTNHVACGMSCRAPRGDSATKPAATSSC
jgi:hypothetical protein